jgi:hypothetical protein
MWDKVEQFFHNLVAVIGRCVAADLGALDTAVPLLICVGILWFIGSAFYELILDPHAITAATLDALSINPDKWLPR